LNRINEEDSLAQKDTDLKVGRALFTGLAVGLFATILLSLLLHNLAIGNIIGLAVGVATGFAIDRVDATSQQEQ